jgi:hypothetical protein
MSPKVPDKLHIASSCDRVVKSGGGVPLPPPPQERASATSEQRSRRDGNDEVMFRTMAEWALDSQRHEDSVMTWVQAVPALAQGQCARPQAVPCSGASGVTAKATHARVAASGDPRCASDASAAARGVPEMEAGAPPVQAVGTEVQAVPRRVQAVRTVLQAVGSPVQAAPRRGQAVGTNARQGWSGRTDAWSETASVLPLVAHDCRRARRDRARKIQRPSPPRSAAPEAPTEAHP